MKTKKKELEHSFTNQKSVKILKLNGQNYEVEKNFLNEEFAHWA
jgi:hypothetical protein